MIAVELDFLTVTEAARICRVRPATVRVWLRGGELPGVRRRIGRSFRYLISRTEVLRKLEVMEAGELADGPAPDDWTMTPEEAAAVLG